MCLPIRKVDTDAANSIDATAEIAKLKKRKKLNYEQMVKLAILTQAEASGSSRQAIAAFLKREHDATNKTSLKRALTKMVKNDVLEQNKQRFKLKGFAPAAPEPEPEEEESDEDFDPCHKCGGRIAKEVEEDGRVREWSYEDLCWQCAEPCGSCERRYPPDELRTLKRSGFGWHSKDGKNCSVSKYCEDCYYECREWS